MSAAVYVWASFHLFLTLENKGHKLHRLHYTATQTHFFSLASKIINTLSEWHPRPPPLSCTTFISCAVTISLLTSHWWSIDPCAVQVCADSLACLLTPSRGDSEPLSVSIMSHVQKQERLMSFCITSSPLGPDTQCVCVCASACLRERVPHSHRCVWWYVFSLHACVCLCVKQCSSWGAACCSSPYLEADLICCSTAAPDTWKSHD